MRYLHKGITFISCLFLLLHLKYGYCQEGYSFDNATSELSQYITSQMKSNKVVGLSIAIVSDTGTIWSKGFGYADKEKMLVATDTTIYRVASISKLFTATAIMQLVEAGKIDLDMSVKHYLPAFDIKTRFPEARAITIRDLLTHHSGIPSDIYRNLFTDKPIPIEKIVDELNKEYTCFEPGYVYSYSNAGFALLGAITQTVTGEAYEKYMLSEVFGPLQMNQTAFTLNTDLERLYSKAYFKKGPGEEPALRDIPAGMLHSNVLDLSHFIQMVLNNGRYTNNLLLKANTLDQMLTRQYLDAALDMSYQIGLCWFLSDVGYDWKYAGRVIQHGGDTYAYHSMLMIIPEKKIGVVVLSNSYQSGNIVTSIARKALEKTLKAKYNIERPVVKNTGKLKFEKQNITELEQIAGSYVLGSQLFPVSVKRNHLIAKQNGIKIHLKYNNYGFYTPQIRVLGLIPLTLRKQSINFRTVGSEQTIITYIQGDSVLIGNKIEKAYYSSVWKDRVGKYKIMNDDSEFRIIKSIELKMKDGNLFLIGTYYGGQKSSLLLRPLDDYNAIVQGLGRNAGNTITFTSNSFIYSGYHALRNDEE